MKASKSLIKYIKSVAKMLPVMYTGENQKTIRIISGDVLIEKGVTVLDSGIEVSPYKKYQVPVADGIPVNHFKRMMSLIETGGKEAVQSYIDGISQIHGGHKSVMSGYNERMKSFSI